LKNEYIFSGIKCLGQGFLGLGNFIFVLFDLLFEFLDLSFQSGEVLFLSLAAEFALGRIEDFFGGTELTVGIFVFDEHGLGNGGTLRW
jgi:hypothetical protein